MKAFKNGFILFIMAIFVTGLVGCKLCEDVAELDVAPEYGFIGDSVFDRNIEECSDIASFLSILMDKRIINDAVGGAHLTGYEPGNPDPAPSVEDQLRYLIASRDIDVLILTGGGNDILDGCFGFDCQEIIEGIYADAERLVAEVHANGITKILYVGYNMPGLGSMIYGQVLNQMMDDLKTRLPSLGVEFLDTRGLLKICEVEIDGYHPLPVGSAKYADAIHKKLKALGWN